MEMNYIVQTIISILSGLAVCIPLVLKLYNVISAYIKEKNWPKIVEMVMKAMAEAEVRFETGAERKQYVMDAIQVSAATINYPLTDEDLYKISTMIDQICACSKVVNAPVAKED